MLEELDGVSPVDENSHGWRSLVGVPRRVCDVPRLQAAGFVGWCSASLPEQTQDCVNPGTAGVTVLLYLRGAGCCASWLQIRLQMCVANCTRGGSYGRLRSDSDSHLYVSAVSYQEGKLLRGHDYVQGLGGLPGVSPKSMAE